MRIQIDDAESAWSGRGKESEKMRQGLKSRCQELLDDLTAPPLRTVRRVRGNGWEQILENPNGAESPEKRLRRQTLLCDVIVEAIFALQMDLDPAPIMLQAKDRFDSGIPDVDADRNNARDAAMQTLSAVLSQL